MAMVLGDLDDQGMEFVEVLCAVTSGKRRLDCKADFIVRSVFINELVTSEETFGVGVHDEHWIVADVEKNGVCGFGPDAVESEQLPAEVLDFRRGA